MAKTDIERERRLNMLVELLGTDGKTLNEIHELTGLSDTTVLRDMDRLCATRRAHVAGKRAGGYRPMKVFVAGPAPDAPKVEATARRDPLVAAFFGAPA